MRVDVILHVILGVFGDLYTRWKKGKIVHIFPIGDIDEEGEIFRKYDRQSYEFGWFGKVREYEKSKEGWKKVKIFSWRYGNIIYVDKNDELVYMCRKK